MVYHGPTGLSEGMASFMDYYNHQQYQEAMGEPPQRMVYYGRKGMILARRVEVK